jgi:hypothetical protein
MVVVFPAAIAWNVKGTFNHPRRSRADFVFLRRPTRDTILAAIAVGPLDPVAVGTAIAVLKNFSSLSLRRLLGRSRRFP